MHEEQAGTVSQTCKIKKLKQMGDLVRTEPAGLSTSWLQPHQQHHEKHLWCLTVSCSPLCILCTNKAFKPEWFIFEDHLSFKLSELTQWKLSESSGCSGLASFISSRKLNNCRNRFIYLFFIVNYNRNQSPERRMMLTMILPVRRWCYTFCFLS